MGYLFNIIEPKLKFKVSEHDKDNKFIDCAVEANADYIISGDNHLLKIKEFKDINI